MIGALPKPDHAYTTDTQYANPTLPTPPPIPAPHNVHVI